MLKENEWYFIPADGKLNFNDTYIEVLGSLAKIVKIHDNTLYADTEEWWVTQDRKFLHKGILTGMDSVVYSKFGRKVNAPPKVFEVLYSETVNQKLDTDQSLDAENEYNEE